jgi:flagellar motility protein MotE (MotC chaperone)
MRFKPRLLPVVILATSLMLVVRLNGLWHEAGMALAQATPPAKATTAPRQVAETTQPAPATSAPTGAGDPLKASQPPKFSPAEVDLLQDLSKRRNELDQREDEVARREVQLKALEQEINGRIDKLNNIKSQIDELLGKVDAQEEERLKSLVVIYQTMKPTDAARILNQIDLPILLQVLTRMKESKSSPIIGALEPGKAKAVTDALAARPQLPDIKNN